MSKAADAPRQNRLAAESSAYLRQHMHNPVDWYPWGPEALEQARLRDKPLLVSIGYSACHWCHVMEHESFEDAETAALMNEHFVSIKVDREERPDLDQIYMDTVTRLTGHGGWPLTVFCTPDGTPFYAGTYFPPEPRHGLPSFRQLLLGVAQAWRERRERGEAERAAASWPRSRRRPRGRAENAPGAQTAAQAALRLLQGADAEHGGFGSRAQVPDALLSRAAAGGGRRAARAQGARGARPRRVHLPRDGARRRLRPAGRRLPPLQRRRALGGAALREDALRPGTAPARLRRSLAPERRQRRRPALAGARDRRLPAPRDAALPRAASTPARTPTARARRASTTSSPPNRSTPCSAPRPAPPSAGPTA